MAVLLLTHLLSQPLAVVQAQHVPSFDEVLDSEQVSDLDKCYVLLKQVEDPDGNAATHHPRQIFQHAKHCFEKACRGQPQACGNTAQLDLAKVGPTYDARVFLLDTRILPSRMRLDPMAAMFEASIRVIQ